MSTTMGDRPLSRAQNIERVQHKINGTIESLEQVLEALDLEDSGITEDDLLDGALGVERCRCCDWWCQVSELAETGLCDTCRTASGEEEG